MELSPFPHQGPLEPDQVVGRDELVDDLIEQVTRRRVTTLLGPRRFGKTSVLRRVATDLESAGTSVVWVDLYEASSMADVVERFDDGLRRAIGPARRWLDDYSASFGLHLGVLRAELRRRSAERPEPVELFHRQLDAIVEAAQVNPVVCVVDEFGGAFGVEGVAGLMRTKFQHHYRELGLLFAGSQPTLMLQMFTDRSMPFYAQADLVEIEPFDAATIATIIDHGFTTSGRHAGPAGRIIAEFANGHPHRSMQLADAAWETVGPGGRFTERDWPDVVRRVADRSRLGLEALFSGRTSGAQAVLRLLAHGESLFGVAAEHLGLSSSSAYRARDQLVERGDVWQVGDRYELVDPIFADWIRARFP